MEINLDKFKLALAKKLMTNNELAVKSKVSKSVISNLLNGKKLTVKPVTLGKLAKALGVNVEDLI